MTAWVPCPVSHKRETEEERINIYAKNTPASKYTKQISTDLKREIDGHTKIAENSSLSFSITLSIILTENELETRDFVTNAHCSQANNILRGRSCAESQYKCKKFKKTETISSLFQPQCEEPRQHQQTEKQKIHKYVERIQPTPEQ